MTRRPAWLGMVAAAVAVVVAVAGCVPTSAGSDGGPTTALTLQLAPSPSWHPVGPAIRTGVLVGDAELVVYFWAGGDGTGTPYVAAGWLDPHTGEFVDQPHQRDGRGVPVLGGGSAQGDSTTQFIGIHQVAFVGYPLIEWGAIHGHPARIVVESGGRAAEATVIRWPHEGDVTIFWLERPGEPIPADTPIGDGATRPLPPEYYPLVTAYDDAGAVVDSLRLRGTGGGPRGG